MNGPQRPQAGPALDHMIVLAGDKNASARFLTWLLGLPEAQPQSIFLEVPLGNAVTILFKEVEPGFPGQHYAFRVEAEEYPVILRRVQAAGVPYRSSPTGGGEGETYELKGEQGFYLYDPCGHQLEVLTDA